MCVLISVLKKKKREKKALNQKNVSKDPKKQVLLGAQGGGGDLPCKATNLVIIVYDLYRT